MNSVDTLNNAIIINNMNTSEADFSGQMAHDFAYSVFIAVGIVAIVLIVSYIRTKLQR